MILLACGAVPALAASPQPRSLTMADLPALIRADRWDDARSVAIANPDPLVAKLVEYFRVMAPGAASFDDIVAFMKSSPDWPLQYSLARRRDEALAAIVDDAEAAADCDRFPPNLPGAVLRCAVAYGHLGREADAGRLANRAWASGEKFVEAALLAQFGAQLSPASDVQRFNRLAVSDLQAAAQQLLRLAPQDRPHAEAMLALRRDAPNALNLVAALPAAEQKDPALVLEMLRFLRRADRDDDALAMWRSTGFAVEAAAPAGDRAAFWDERNRMARRRLVAGDADGAYDLANDTAKLGVDQAVDAEFLAGFIALRRQSKPDAAAEHFRRLAAMSKSAITQGRAHYWLARSLAAAGNASGAAAEYEKSAAYPNTFYGQIALVALGRDPFARIRDEVYPPPDPQRIADLANREVGRAAAYLIAWGENRRAVAFLFRLDAIAPDPDDRKLVARIATSLGAPDIAVDLARNAGRDGVVELETGWPAPVPIPPDVGLDPALAYGIIRQESSFDGSTISPVGARGLMQLMPETARTVGKKSGIKVAIDRLTVDSATNIRLGSIYLRGLLDQFGGVEPFAIAGYNAGPGRVADWIGQNGDPTAGQVDMLDWIELIPFSETRNYVQRVIENQVVYAAHGAGLAQHPLAQYLGKGS
jgi:soluble lytic murein transglycosylase